MKQAAGKNSAMAAPPACGRGKRAGPLSPVRRPPPRRARQRVAAFRCWVLRKPAERAKTRTFSARLARERRFEDAASGGSRRSRNGLAVAAPYA
jgi:hypothetical protein